MFMARLGSINDTSQGKAFRKFTTFLSKNGEKYRKQQDTHLAFREHPNVTGFLFYLNPAFLIVSGTSAT